MAQWPRCGRVVARGLVTALAIAMPLLATHAADNEPRSDDADSVITPANVPSLQLVFSFRTESAGAHTAPPQVDANTLFVLTPFPHTIYALDLTRPEPSITWRYMPPANGVAAGLQCCGATSGGMTLAAGHLLLATQDGHVTALQASDGTVLWDTALGHPEGGEVLATSPTVVGDKVIVGNSGEDFGVRGWLAALDVTTGHTVWKVFNTGPDSDVGIGSEFHPQHQRDYASDLGITSWPPSTWQQGGGGLAGRPVSDDARHLLLYATGPPAPWNPMQRQGDNRWTSGLFARDPDTGTALWFDAMNPHDQYALGAGGGLILGELEVGGRRRALLIHPDRNGYVYVLDRASGDILSAERFLPVTATLGIDRTGAFRALMTDVRCTPARRATSAPRGRQAMPRNPRLRLHWPALHRRQPSLHGHGGARRQLSGWYAVYRRHRAHAACQGRVGRCADRVGCRGRKSRVGSRRTRPAARRRAGHRRWRRVLRHSRRYAEGARCAQRCDAVADAAELRVVSRPTAFRGPDGKAWLAVLAGPGSLVGMPSASEIDLRDASAAKGLAGLLHDLPPPADRSGTLYVFRLP